MQDLQQDGRTLFVSRSAPPGVSGSAHVLKALLDFDGGRRLAAVGGCGVFRKRRRTPHLALLRSELSFFGRGARFLAPAREILKPMVARRLARMAADPSIASLLCVFPDAFYCEAALEASLRTGKPLDLWFHNTYADNRSGLAGIRADRLERRLVDSARRLFFISEALRERFTDKYPSIAGRSSVVRHPVAAAADRGQAPRGFRNAPVRALMMGNLNESNLDAAGRMLRALGGRADLEIALCTPVPRSLLAARGIRLDGVNYLGYVDDTEMARLLEDADLFLLPHGLTGGYSSAEYRTIFPTRAAHFLAQGRPILAHCPADSGLATYLRDKDCAMVVSSAEEVAVADAFEALLRDPARQLELAAHARHSSGDFAPQGVLATLTGILRQ